MAEPEGEEVLLKAIREAEERVRILIEGAEREREGLLRRAREEGASLREEKERSLKERLNFLREEEERAIRLEVEEIVREGDLRAADLARRGEERREKAGRSVLEKVLGGSDDCPDDQSSNRGAQERPGAGDGNPP